MGCRESPPIVTLLSGCERTTMMRIKWEGGELGAQSQTELRGDRWTIDGEPDRHNSSARTRRITYGINRF